MIVRTFLLLLSFSVIILHTDVLAQESVSRIDTNRISDLDIEEHFTKIDSMLTSERPNMQKVIEYADQYLADNFAMKRRVKTNDASNLGAAEESFATREQFLEEFKDERKVLYNSSLKHRILDIEHNKDNNTAKVTYSSLFKGFIKAMDKDNAWYSQEFIQLSQCYDLLKLVDGQVKSFRAECDIEVIQKDPVKL